MNHIYHLPNFGEDWFTFPNLYSRLVRETPDGGTIVEVGVWKGKSLSYLGVEVVNSGKKINVHGIDMWTAGLHGGDNVHDNVVYNIAMNNLRPLEGVVQTFRMSSLEGPRLYQDESLDVVFIDACHTYDCVKADIAAWLPKVKRGGYLAGHDYNQDDVSRAVNEALTDIESTEVCWVYRKP